MSPPNDPESEPLYKTILFFILLFAAYAVVFDDRAPPEAPSVALQKQAACMSCPLSKNTISKETHR